MPVICQMLFEWKYEFNQRDVYTSFKKNGSEKLCEMAKLAWYVHTTRRFMSIEFISSNGKIFMGHRSFSSNLLNDWATESRVLRGLVNGKVLVLHE